MQLHDFPVLALLTSAFGCGPGEPDGDPPPVAAGGAAGSASVAGQAGATSQAGSVGGSGQPTSSGAGAGGTAAGSENVGGGGSSGGGVQGTLNAAHAICKRGCAAGCQIYELEPERCVHDCDFVFYEASMTCVVELETYVDCLRTTELLYFCPNYGEGSPCYAEAAAMIACINASDG